MGYDKEEQPAYHLALSRRYLIRKASPLKEQKWSNDPIQLCFPALDGWSTRPTSPAVDALAPIDDTIIGCPKLDPKPAIEEWWPMITWLNYQKMIPSRKIGLKN